MCLKVRGRRGAAMLALLATVPGLLAVPGPTMATPHLRTVEDPSWEDVERARSDATAAESEAARITAVLSTLEDNAARRADEAVARQAEADAAAARLAHTEQRLRDLEDRLVASRAESVDARESLGRLTAQLSRSAGTHAGLGLLTSPGDPDDALYRLGTLARLTERTTTVREAAEHQANALAALEAEAAAVRSAREALATRARSSRDRAEAARADAETAMQDAQVRSETIYAQLALLRSTSAEVERQYREAEARRAAFAAQEAAARAQAEAAARAAAETEAAARSEAEEEERVPASGAGGNGGGDRGVTPSPPAASAGSWTPAAAQAHAATAVTARGWGSDQFSCLVRLWNRESGWRWNAYNSSSGAYGIPQSLPGSKMASAGADWQTNAATQISWGLSYISSRYGTPCGAWAHSESHNWY